MKSARRSFEADEKPTNAQQPKTSIDNLCAFAHKRIDEVLASLTKSTRQLINPAPLQGDQQAKIQWLKSLISVLINSKENLEQLLSSNEQICCKQYELSLQKLEAQIRQHIAIQQQLKLHMDSLQEHIADLELDRNKLLAELERINRKNKRTIEDEPPKTARVRSSSSNLLIKDRTRLKSREKHTDISKENSNLINTNGSTMNMKKPKKEKEAGRIRNCR